MKLVWVESSGGPLILVPLDALGGWEGCDRPSGLRAVEARSRWGDPSSPASDYDRACDVEDWIDVVRVGGADALVLGAEPLATAWVPGVTGGALVRRSGTLDDDAVVTLVSRVLDRTAGADELEVRVSASELLLFDAAFRGDQPEARDYGEVVRVEPGLYAVGAHVLSVPDGDAVIVVHAFRRRAE